MAHIFGVKVQITKGVDDGNKRTLLDNPNRVALIDKGCRLFTWLPITSIILKH